MKMRILFGLAAMAALTATLVAADVDLSKVKCVVNPKAGAKAEKSADYRGGHVYFCCDNCKRKFTTDSKPFAVPANAQLVATKQFKQKACPLSGGKLDPATAIEVGGVKVCFCCNNCKGKVAGTEGDAQTALVFADAAFEKGFAAAKAE
ncbi:MAG: hypothetical protein KDA66_07880 [Planctomycetaceae bacterium]|nr:hypothetical protein [Planctomycetaceae bacterium]